MQNSKAKRLRSKLAYTSCWVMEVESSLSRYHCWFVTVTVGLSWLLVFSWIEIFACVLHLWYELFLYS